MVRKAYDRIVSMAVEPNIDTEAAIKLQLTGYNITYSPSAKGQAVFFQELKHIKFQLIQTNVDDTLTRLELSDNVIKTITLAAFRKCGHLQQNIDFIKAGWKKVDADFNTANSAEEINATKNSRFKTHCIVNLSWIYKGGDKDSTSCSANSVTADNIATQFAAFEATQQLLQ